jgi:hypothetical protein
MTERLPARRILYVAVMAAVILVAGWALARSRLPEWQLGPPQSPEFFAERLDEMARQIGLPLESSAPEATRVALAPSPSVGNEDGGLEGAALLQLGAELEVRVERAVRLPGGGLLLLDVYFDPEGAPRGLRWQDGDLLGYLRDPGRSALLREALSLAAKLLMAPGESLEGDDLDWSSPGLHRAGIAGGSGHLVLLTGTGTGIARRLPGPVPSPEEQGLGLAPLVLAGMFRGLLFLGVAAAFFIFLARGRIDLVNGALQGGFGLVLLLLGALPWKPGFLGALEGVLYPLVLAVSVFVLWSTGESWHRSSAGDGTLSLDLLRAGRVGPRGGRALLQGVSLGAALAGLRLLLSVGVRGLPGVQIEELSVPLPIWGAGGNPLVDGILVAGAALLAASLCREISTRLWLPPAALLTTFLVPVLAIAPLGWKVVFNFLWASALLLILHFWGATVLWGAAVSAGFWLSALFAAAHPGWLSLELWAAVAVLGVAAVAGLVGLRRSPNLELEGMGGPAFLRRLERERRTRYEMGLLARMQVGLLPESVPQPEGWEISARSILASEVGGDLYDFLPDEQGRLWIAAGDVAGHGYSCAISQAMTKAALASLVEADRTPGEVLERADRVLRSARSRRNFTSLVLVRLEPESGVALVANAGHPYPMIFRSGEVEELVAPGLPLGQGPARAYADHPFELAPGEVLVLCSDGLFEAVDRNDEPLGFDRPREVLRKGARWASSEILEMLVAEWRRHRDRSTVEDDTTVVVIKRRAAPREPAGRTGGAAALEAR